MKGPLNEWQPLKCHECNPASKKFIAEKKHAFILPSGWAKIASTSPPAQFFFC